MSDNFNKQCRNKVGQLGKNENFYKGVIQDNGILWKRIWLRNFFSS